MFGHPASSSSVKIVSVSPLSLILGAFIALLAAANPAGAQIHILDCNGSSRAYKAKVVQGNNEVNIRVVDSAQNPNSGARVNLVNKNGQKLSTVSKNGNAFFPEVPDGTWVIDPADKGLFFTEVSVFDPTPLWISNGTAVGAGVAAAGVGVGAAALGGAFNGNGGGNGGDHALPSPGPTPSDTCPECNPDDIPPSVNPFSLSQGKVVKMDLSGQNKPQNLSLNSAAFAKPSANAAPRTITEGSSAGLSAAQAARNTAARGASDRLGHGSQKKRRAIKQ